MSETPDERKARVRQWSNDQRDCRVCGMKRINVRHEPDPVNAPEGADYYAAISEKLHPFAPPPAALAESGGTE